MILEEEVKISTVSEFSILPNTQSRKLGYLGQIFFASNFERSCNLDAKTTVKFTETKT